MLSTGLILQTGDTKRQIIELMIFFPPHLSSAWKGKKKAAGTNKKKKKEEAGNHVTSNLLIFCLEKEVGGVKWTGGSCWNEIYCKWEKTPTRDRCSQMETLLNQDKLQMGLDFLFFILTENRLKLPSETLLQRSKSRSTHGRKINSTSREDDRTHASTTHKLLSFASF